MKTKSEKIMALLDKGVTPHAVAKKMGITPAYVYVVRSNAKKKADARLSPLNKAAKPKPGRPKKTQVERSHDPKVVKEYIKEVEALYKKADPVNHPPHYTAGGIETLDFIEAKDLNFRLANVVKYVSRAGKKVGGDPIQDLEKAAFYLNREIAVRKSA